MYRVYGVLLPNSDFTLDEAARRLTSRLPRSGVRLADGVISFGTDDWSMQLMVLQGADVLTEHSGIAERIPGDDEGELAASDRRVEAWSDTPDVGMEHFADFQTVIEVLKTFCGLIAVDPKEPGLL